MDRAGTQIIKVPLSPPEVRIAKYIGKLRNEYSLETKPNARRDPSQTDEEMNIQAFGAELAVAKLLNVYPDLTPTKGDLPKWDLALRKLRYEVKRNHLDDGDLLVPKLNRDLMYILACGGLPEYRIIGYLQGTSVEILGEWVELTYGPCWRVHPKHLRSMATFFTG